MITSINKFKTYIKANESNITESIDINKLEKTIKDLKEKIKNQGHVTNARDEEHLENLLKLYEDTIEEREDNFDEGKYDNDEDAYFKRQQYESNITEDVDNVDNTDTIVKALDDIDERRPNRMKRPPKADYNPWNGRGGEQGMVYIQDEAEEVMQDKYGRDRGTRNWEASIGHGARGGAMFKMADDVMKEKQFLFDELGLTPSSYWDYSYFDMWKKWMNKIGKPYKIDSDADVQAKKDAKEQAEKEAKRLAKEKKQQEAKEKLTTELNNIRDKYSSLNLDKFTPDAKDRKRIEDLINNNRSTSSTLANKMANAIKNRSKAIKRGLAGLEYYENLTDVDSLTYLYAEEVIKPFFDKAMKLNESYAINEGQFSWLTQDTNTQIGSELQNKISVYMYDNKGNKWHEPDYDGYGEFGGKDFYDLTAEMNGYSEKDIIYNHDLRQFGIDLAYDKIQTKNQDGKLLFPALVEDENYDITNHDFTERPESDPNQGWFVEDEYDNEYGDYDEDDLYESKIYTTIKEFKQYIKESNNEMLHINLLNKYIENGNDILYREKFDKFKHKIEGFKETHDELDLKIGDIIEFNGGYNNDIRYTTEILGFDSDNDIYLLWESYWYPIKNDNKRNIIKVNNNNINESVSNDKFDIVITPKDKITRDEVDKIFLGYDYWFFSVDNDIKFMNISNDDLDKILDISNIEFGEENYEFHNFDNYDDDDDMYIN